MEIKVPELALVALVGISGSGKSSFARKHFLGAEVLSSDACRAMVSNDENDQSATEDAFDVLYYIAGKRLKKGLLTVVDATNVQSAARKNLIQMARTHHALSVAIVLNLPLKVCETRNTQRADRNFGSHVLPKQHQQLRKSLKGLKREGFHQIYVLNSEEEVDAVQGIVRQKLYCDLKDERGPFDILGDVHGCLEELLELLAELGYAVTRVAEGEGQWGYRVSAPEGRKAVFLGDLVDRGPDSIGVLKLVMSMVEAGVAICVPGNHDAKLLKYLRGKQVQLTHGLDKTVAQLAGESEAFKAAAAAFLDSLISHYVLDGGRLVVAHAGLKEDMQGRGSAAVRAFCLYGETTGEIDEFGLPVRYPWANEYRGKAMVVYGHTPVPQAEWLNQTMDIDTGCVFGGRLTALRYPEKELVSVAARAVYCEPTRPLVAAPTGDTLAAQQEHDDVLDIADVMGHRMLQTRLLPHLTVHEENAIAALEVMSRFAVNPKWLIYLPPTMAPCASSVLPDYLEHPEEALQYYRSRGGKQVVCEEKHMGSRAVLVICQDEAVAEQRFGVKGGGLGVCYTRTGRNFFHDAELERAFLERVNGALTRSGFWERFETDWVCLDAELMPWSAKAQALIRSQYARVGAAARVALPEAGQALAAAMARGVAGADGLLAAHTLEVDAVTRYIGAYQRYCWAVDSLDDYRLAPFHILATEGAVHVDKTHRWHMEEIARVCAVDAPFLMATAYRVVDLEDAVSCQDAVDWWLKLTAGGGEGMVVKPMDFVTVHKSEVIQPAVKCRGREYLRMIYGPNYAVPETMGRLKSRSLKRKYGLALKEFALSVEGLERFARREPLRRVHEMVFGILALESEEVDPRL